MEKRLRSINNLLCSMKVLETTIKKVLRSMEKRLRSINNLLALSKNSYAP